MRSIEERGPRTVPTDVAIYGPQTRRSYDLLPFAWKIMTEHQGPIHQSNLSNSNDVYLHRTRSPMLEAQCLVR